MSKSKKFQSGNEIFQKYISGFKKKHRKFNSMLKNDRDITDPILQPLKLKLSSINKS